MNRVILDEDDSEISPADLGRKDFWDERYDLEKQNYVEFKDEGEIWFGKSSQSRCYSYLKEKKVALDARILDLGCGNGALLRLLHAKGFRDLTGIDYCQSAIDLAVCDLLAAEVPERLGGRFDVLLDKGTYDAIALSDDGAANRRRYSRLLPDFLRGPTTTTIGTADVTLSGTISDGLSGTTSDVSCGQTDLLSGPTASDILSGPTVPDIPSGPRRLLLLFSCNFTREELLADFTKEDGYEFVGEIPAKSQLVFGGATGVTVTALVFRL